MAKDSKRDYERSWTVLPEPGFAEVDPEVLANHLLQLEGYATYLGFATTFSPIRVKLNTGQYVTKGYNFRAFSVPAFTEEEFARLAGLDLEEPAGPESPESPDVEPDLDLDEIDRELVGSGTQ
jgi:hypothetical protein